jgi:hypothetical protein
MMILDFIFFEEDFLDISCHCKKSSEEESSEKKYAEGTELSSMEPMSEEPVSPDFDSDIEYEKYNSCAV